MKDVYPILIVEDNIVEQFLLKKKLSDSGYKVTVTGNGEEALAALQKKFYPIIITDWMMPKIDGLELCSIIRKKNFSSYIFIIFLTSNSQQGDVITGLDAGADDYLKKPVNFQELMARIRAGCRILDLEKKLSTALEKIKTMAITDHLTGCYNRRYLTEFLYRELKRSMRYGHYLSISMFDIDHFKKINDTYGHHIGDNALCEIVNNIKSEIRLDLDWLARYGGEEFLLVFPETDLNGAKLVIERIRKHLTGMVIPEAPLTLKLTLSFGITTFEPSKFNKKIFPVEDMIKVADKYLYMAKESGRNKAIAGPFDELLSQ